MPLKYSKYDVLKGMLLSFRARKLLNVKFYTIAAKVRNIFDLINERNTFDLIYSFEGLDMGIVLGTTINKINKPQYL